MNTNLTDKKWSDTQPNRIISSDQWRLSWYVYLFWVIYLELSSVCLSFPGVRSFIRLFSFGIIRARAVSIRLVEFCLRTRALVLFKVSRLGFLWGVSCFFFSKWHHDLAFLSPTFSGRTQWRQSFYLFFLKRPHNLRLGVFFLLFLWLCANPSWVWEDVSAGNTLFSVFLIPFSCRLSRRWWIPLLVLYRYGWLLDWEWR